VRVLTGMALGGRRSPSRAETSTDVDNSLTPKPFVRGLVSYSGRGNHVNTARHVRRLARCSKRCVDYPVAQPARAGTNPLLCTERVSAGAAKFADQKKGEKKRPPR